MKKMRSRKGGKQNWQFYYTRNSISPFPSPLLQGGKSKKNRKSKKRKR